MKEEKDEIVGVKEEKGASEMKGEEGDLIVDMKEVNAMKGEQGGKIVGMVDVMKGEKEDQIVGGCDRRECCVCDEGQGQRLDCGCEREHCVR